MAERADYPADVSKLRKLLLALSDAKIVEERPRIRRAFHHRRRGSIARRERRERRSASSRTTARHARDRRQTGRRRELRHARSGENTSYSVEPGDFLRNRTALLDRITAASTSRHPTFRASRSSRRRVPRYAVHRAATPSARRISHSTARRPAASGGFRHARRPRPHCSADLTVDDVVAGRRHRFQQGHCHDSDPHGRQRDHDHRCRDRRQALGYAAGEPKMRRSTRRPPAARSRLTSYRFDAIFRPLEQLLMPKEPPPGAKKTDSLKASPPTSPSRRRNRCPHLHRDQRHECRIRPPRGGLCSTTPVLLAAY